MNIFPFAISSCVSSEASDSHVSCPPRAGTGFLTCQLTSLFYLAVEQKAPPALRHRNLRNGDGQLEKHRLNPACWKVLISAIIAALLPYQIDDNEVEGKPVRLDYDRFCKTSRADKCILSHDRGRGRQLHKPVHITPTRTNRAWTASTLTQMPDSRWKIEFTHVPTWINRLYHSRCSKGDSIRAEHKTPEAFGRPAGGRSMTVVALLCWWAYGRPRFREDIATHFACDQARCLNPRHIGWAKPGDNSRHASHHRRTLQRAGEERVARYEDCPVRRLTFG